MSECGADFPRLRDKDALRQEILHNRTKRDPAFRPPQDVEPTGPGEESVWDYPRPPIVVPASRAVRVSCGDAVVAHTARALVVKETAGAPVPYFSPGDVQTQRLVANGDTSVCEWKGEAVHFDLLLPDGECVAGAAWCYPDPFDDLGEGYTAIAGRLAFYPAKLACFVEREDGEWERARSQPGNVYGGWVTDRIRGPIKGAPGTQHW